MEPKKDADDYTRAGDSANESKKPLVLPERRCRRWGYNDGLDPHRWLVPRWSTEGRDDSGVFPGCPRATPPFPVSFFWWNSKPKTVALDDYWFSVREINFKADRNSCMVGFIEGNDRKSVDSGIEHIGEVILRKVMMVASHSNRPGIKHERIAVVGNYSHSCEGDFSLRRNFQSPP